MWPDYNGSPKAKANAAKSGVVMLRMLPSQYPEFKQRVEAEERAESALKTPQPQLDFGAMLQSAEARVADDVEQSDIISRMMSSMNPAQVRMVRMQGLSQANEAHILKSIRWGDFVLQY